jgi:calcium-dependent protein kinase
LEKQKENTNLAELKKIIEYVDTDKNGKINYSEFLACCLESSMMQTEAYLEYVFKELDVDRSGKISKNEIKRIFE